jgi:uncharacterized membrane-anchored protein YjiN (DUF445 family)
MLEMEKSYSIQENLEKLTNKILNKFNGQKICIICKRTIVRKKNNEIIKEKKRIIPCIATEVNIHNAILEFASYCKKQQNKHCKSKKKELKLFVYIDGVNTSDFEFIWLMPETLTGKHLFGKIVEELNVDNDK